MFDTIKVTSEEDVVMEGIGFLRLSQDAVIRIHHVANVQVYIRPSVFRKQKDIGIYQTS